MKLNKLVQLYAGITRVNEEERIVEGVAFANETVEGEGGIRLKREAMQAATPDYLRWGAVREMHTASAAGTQSPAFSEAARFGPLLPLRLPAEEDRLLAVLCGLPWRAVGTACTGHPRPPVPRCIDERSAA